MNRKVTALAVTGLVALAPLQMANAVDNYSTIKPAASTAKKANANSYINTPLGQLSSAQAIKGILNALNAERAYRGGIGKIALDRTLNQNAVCLSKSYATSQLAFVDGTIGSSLDALGSLSDMRDDQVNKNCSSGVGIGGSQAVPGTITPVQLVASWVRDLSNFAIYVTKAKKVGLSIVNYDAAVQGGKMVSILFSRV